MINYFLNQGQGMSEQKRKIIQKKFLYRRKYNPFHLDCQYTKKKLCYCKKNPMTHLSQGQKVSLWSNTFMKAHQFYQNSAEKCFQQNTQSRRVQQSKISNNTKMKQNEEKQKKNEQHLIQQTARQFNVCVQKIRAISKQQLIQFIHQYQKKYKKTNVDGQNGVNNIY